MLATLSKTERKSAMKKFFDRLCRRLCSFISYIFYYDVLLSERPRLLLSTPKALATSHHPLQKSISLFLTSFHFLFLIPLTLSLCLSRLSQKLRLSISIFAYGKNGVHDASSTQAIIIFSSLHSASIALASANDLLTFRTVPRRTSEQMPRKFEFFVYLLSSFALHSLINPFFASLINPL